MDTLSAAIMLFLIMDPLGNLPIVMSVLKPFEPKRRLFILARELLFSLIILLIFLYSGDSILTFLNIKQETVSIAGGIILFLIALKMIFPTPGGVMNLPVGEEPFIVPLAIPMIAGPSSMAALILLSNQAPTRIVDWTLAFDGNDLDHAIDSTITRWCKCLLAAKHFIKGIIVTKPTLSTFAQIRALSPKQSLAFSVTLLSRMIPHVALYDELNQEVTSELALTGVAKVEVGPLADKVLGLVWDYLANPKNKFNFGVQLEKIEMATPDVTDNTPFGVLPAMDACIGLSALLRLLQQEQDDAAVMISKLAQGGIEAMLLATEFAEENAQIAAIEDEESKDNAYFAVSKKLKAHPLMEFEIAFQNEILQYVHTHKLNEQSVKDLQQLVQETGITTLGIELE
jgi:uncharacterized protein YjaG (DUF416 family)